MESERRRMAGRFYVIPHEVHDKLEEMKEACGKIYRTILRRVIMEEEGWDTDQKWITGRFDADKGLIRTWSGVSTSHFYRSWNELIEAGLLQEGEIPSGGTRTPTYRLPYYKKRADTGITISEIKEMASRLVYVEGRIEEFADSLEEMIKASRGVKIPSGGNTSSGGKGVKIPSGGTDRPSGGNGSFKEEIDQKPLSPNSMISGFYRGIGQEKISRQKRERAIKVFKKLRKDGFTPDQIAFAVEWTLENAKEQPYDFSIIEHTIGQAIAAREREEAESREIDERETREREEREQIEREEEEREEIEAYKESLDPDQRAELREKAIAEINEAGEYKKEFVNDFLINLKENEILRRKLSDENGVEKQSER